METARARQPYLTIRPSSGWAPLDLRELWRFRDLLLTLAKRDIKLRYRQTALGVIWVVLQPLLGAGIFSIVFGAIAKLPTGGLPPFLFSYANLLAWNAFNTTLTKSSTSLVNNAHLVSKVYFPRLALPLSTIFSTLIDFAVALAMMAVLMAIYRVAPTPALLLMPVWLLVVLLAGAGAGLLAGALTVNYRDVQYIVPVLLMLLLYASPIGYDVTAVPRRLLPIYFANPLLGILEAFQHSILGRGTVHWGSVIYSVAFAVLLFVGGAIAFKRMERKFADVI